MQEFGTQSSNLLFSNEKPLGERINFILDSTVAPRRNFSI